MEKIFYLASYNGKLIMSLNSKNEKTVPYLKNISGVKKFMYSLSKKIDPAEYNPELFKIFKVTLNFLTLDSKIEEIST